MTKSAEPDKMLNAIREVSAGRRYPSNDISRGPVSAALEENALMAHLTPKEFDVFRMITNGQSIPHISETLHLSPKTIYNHMTAIRQKLETDSDVKPMKMAWRLRLITMHSH